jgi:Phytochelatin synthase
MGQTQYRRTLPSDAIAFSSSERRRLFAEASATGGLDGYFQLAEQFHTQSDPAFCGLGSLVVALNALAIDPERQAVRVCSGCRYCVAASMRCCRSNGTGMRRTPLTLLPPVLPVGTLPRPVNNAAPTQRQA